MPIVISFSISIPTIPLKSRSGHPYYNNNIAHNCQAVPRIVGSLEQKVSYSTGLGYSKSIAWAIVKKHL